MSAPVMADMDVLYSLDDYRAILCLVGEMAGKEMANCWKWNFSGMRRWFRPLFRAGISGGSSFRFGGSRVDRLESRGYRVRGYGDWY